MNYELLECGGGSVVTKVMKTLPGMPLYKGTYRGSPSYAEQYPGTHEYNKMFLEKCVYSKSGDIDTLEEAQLMLDMARKYFPRENYEIVLVTTGDESPPSGATFYGYEVSIGTGPSMLWQVLYLAAGDRQENVPSEFAEVRAETEPLCKVIENYFGGLLNENGLFATPSDARQFLQCLQIVNRFFPSYYESDDYLNDLEVCAVYGIKY